MKRALFLLVLASACELSTSNWTPALIGVGSPDQVLIAGSLLTVQGRFFAPGATLFIDGTPMPTQRASDTVLSTSLTEAIVEAVGTHRITASNPGSDFSNALALEIAQSNLRITSVSPTRIPANQDSTLTITGTGFTSAVAVTWNGAALATTFVSTTEITVVVPARLVPQPATAKLEVGGAQFDIQVGTGTMKVVASAATYLAWDAVHGVILASRPDGDTQAGFVAGQLFAVDPVTGAIGATVNESDDSISIASDSSHLLTVAGSSLFRYDLPGLANRTSLPVSMNPGGFVQAAPGMPDTSMVEAGNGLHVLDGTTLRSTGLPFESHQGTWGATAATYYAVDSAGDVYLCPIDASGFEPCTRLQGITPFGGPVFDRVANRLVFNNGDDYDAQGGDKRHFAISGNCRAATDGAVNRVFFLCYDPSVGGLTFTAWDFTTQALLGTQSLGVGPPPGTALLFHDLLRWGDNGLAAATNNGIVIYSGDLVR
jgi:hypothetical protein